MNLIRVRFGLPSRIFPKHEASCLFFAMIQEIPQQAGQQPRPEHESCGLEVEANLDFHDEDFFSECFNISKQSIYHQVAYRGIV